MPPQLLLILSVLAFILGALGIWQIHSLRQRLNAVLGSADDRKIEQALLQYHSDVRDVGVKLDRLLNSYRHLSEVASLASQKISVVRFNPFGDTGGDQSFVLAVLDAHDSGYVLTSIHGREGTRVYVKPIDYGKSKYTLSKEEKQALDQAAKRVPLVKKEEKDG